MVNWFKYLLPSLLLLWLSGCLSSATYDLPTTDILPQDKTTEKQISDEDNINEISSIDDKKSPIKKIKKSESKQEPIIIPSKPDQSLSIHDESSEDSPLSSQELLDSALDYCQASNDFWEQGDLDSALDALDKAYSLILKVNGETDQELLQQKDDLRITISKRIIEVYSSRFTVANGTYKAIPLEMNEHVEKALELFNGKENKFFLAAYKRSGKYRPAIVKALKEAGLPEELSWLPLIESGFKPRALSSARALGMWQFIASTGYKYGLMRDTWIDERMDPEKSTNAAIAYLTQLHNIFGDWTTALAAYNCGERRVLDRIQNQKNNYLDHFWDLYTRLPSETAFYVPKFLAILHIINDPEKYGIVLPEPDPEMRLEEVTINKQVHLKTLAKHLEMDFQDLQGINPELRQSLTPKTSYNLKVPLGKGDVLLAKLNDIPVYRPPVPEYVVHKVRSGETLSVIAKRYGTSINAIMNLNSLKSRSYIKAGWKLKIPSKGAKVLTTRNTTTSYRSSQEESLTEYTVEKGDSLWKIANRYQTTVQSILNMNRLKGSNLQIGQVLMIPSGQISSQPLKTESYKVKKGDSPYLIARKFRMNLHEFLKLNQLTPKSTIFPGQLVRVMVD